MVNRELISPKSIVVVGGSNNIHKPGGRLVRNLLEGHYKGDLYVVNAKEDDVQGLKCYHSVSDIPETELAIISIPSHSCLEVVEILAQQKQDGARHHLHTQPLLPGSGGDISPTETGQSLHYHLRRVRRRDPRGRTHRRQDTQSHQRRRRVLNRPELHRTDEHALPRRLHAAHPGVPREGRRLHFQLRRHGALHHRIGVDEGTALFLRLVGRQLQAIRR